MAVGYKKHTENNNKTEYLLINFDYYDGNDYIARLFVELFNGEIMEKKDGIWYSIICISCENEIYELRWNEDVGNSICIINGTEESDKKLERKLEVVLVELNRRIIEKQKT